MSEHDRNVCDDSGVVPVIVLFLIFISLALLVGDCQLHRIASALERAYPVQKP